MYFNIYLYEINKFRCKAKESYVRLIIKHTILIKNLRAYPCLAHAVTFPVSLFLYLPHHVQKILFPCVIYYSWVNQFSGLLFHKTLGEVCDVNAPFRTDQ